MTSSKLLKEALIDAKAVKDTAIANAKQLMQEAFTPKLQKMFAEKIKEEAEEDETIAKMDEVAPPISKIGGGKVGKIGGEKNQKDVSQGEPKVGSGKVAGGIKSPVGVGDPSGPSQTKPMAPNTVNEEAEEQEEANNKEEMDEITTEDLDELIKELEAEAGQDEEVPTDTAPTEPPAEVPPVENPDVPETPAPTDSVPQSAPMAPPPAQGPACSTAPHSEPDGDEAVPPAPMAPPAEGDVPPVAQNPDDEEVNLDELINSLNEEAEEEDEGKKEEMDENKETGYGTKGASETHTGENSKKFRLLGDKEKIAQSKDIEASKQPNHKGNIGKGAVRGGLKETYEEQDETKEEQDENVVVKENNALKSELNEFKKTVTYLRTQLNEINLLNAKLLYTNKLFKEYNMDNKQKMTIVEQFDLAKSVREVKITYCNLNEALNFGILSRKAKSAQRITEGFASKVVASTKPNKELLTEGSQMANRFRELAGISAKILKQ